MPYRDWLILECRHCGREREDGERFSARGRCVDCGEGRQIANRRQLHAHAGPFFDHWRERCAAAFGALLREALEPTTETEVNHADDP